MLLLSLLAVSFGLTAISLLMVRTSLRRQVRSQLAADLDRSAATFQNMQQQQRQMLAHEADLLADLPSLKALMTTDDTRTIADGAARFAQSSGSAFFALINRTGQVVTCYEDAQPAASSPDLQPLLNSTAGPHFVATNGRLFEVSMRPLYFGSSQAGSLLGYVVIGYAIDNHIAKEVSDAAAADAVFQAGDAVIATTLNPTLTSAFKQQHGPDADVWLGPEHYLVASSILSAPGAPKVQLSVLKSFAEAGRYERHLNQLLLVAGGAVLLLGCVLAIYISGTITRPLEDLVAGVRALGRGDFHYPLGNGGARELREVRDAFETMRQRLETTQKELLEAEKLATIGSMASSISHDLRHYLSAVYANAEFLGYSTTRPEERAELLAEVRLGVQGMTELIESLLIFSRTGRSMQLTYESLPIIVERAASLLRTHPDAQKVAIELDALPSADCWIDAKKMERAIYNLLLNACHAAKFGSSSPRVVVQLQNTEEWIILHVEDNGAGVSATVRATMFQPFVSEGKQGGSGLGLTLASRIAQEHGGSVELDESQPGRTIFLMSIAKSKLQAMRVAESTTVTTHAAVATLPEERGA